MRKRLVKFVATGFGAGYVPWAPGTAGSLVGVGYWWLLATQPAVTYWLTVVAVIAFAIWCTGEAAMDLGQDDPPCVVIDEIAAMPLALAWVGPELWHVALGFAFFRLFDVWKPCPIRKSQKLPGGMGIVIDDLLAAVYACAATHAVIWLTMRAGR